MVNLGGKYGAHKKKVYNYREIAGEKCGPGAQRSQSLEAGGMRRKATKRGVGGHWSPSWKPLTSHCFPGTASPGHGLQKKLQVVDQAAHREDDSTGNSKVVVPRAQKARAECAPMSGPEGKAGANLSLDSSRWEGLLCSRHRVRWT